LNEPKQDGNTPTPEQLQAMQDPMDLTAVLAELRQQNNRLSLDLAMEAGRRSHWHQVATGLQAALQEANDELAKLKGKRERSKASRSKLPTKTPKPTAKPELASVKSDAPTGAVA